MGYRMQCHSFFMLRFTDDDKWFRWTTVQLLKKKEANLHCPRCNASQDVEEIAKSCKMTTDEELFFKLVKNLNGFNADISKFIQKAEFEGGKLY